MGEGEIRRLLAERLGGRRAELLGAAVARVHSFDDPRSVTDPAYGEGLATALAGAVDYSLAGLEEGGRRPPHVPVEILAQARLDARDDIPLDTVTRRYVAVATSFGDFLLEEAARAEAPPTVLRQMLATQAMRLDLLLSAVGAEHAREARNLPTGVAERRRECVKRLLAGDLVDRSGLGYEMEAEHLGVVAKGDAAKGLLRRLAGRLDRELLAVRREEEPVWAAWLGGRRPLAVDEALGALRELIGEERVLVAVGEPAFGLEGWRFTHAQAKAALPLVEHHGPVVRFLDVALEAAIVRDELIATSLRRRYLQPLEGARDGGELARKTLRAWFAAERNVSSTAAALGVDRRTVRNRLAAIEELLGGPLNGSVADMEIALRLAD